MAHNAYLDHRVLVGWGEGETTQHAVEFAYLWNIEAVEIVEDTLAMSIQKHNSHHCIHVLQTICANNCWQTTNSNRTRNHMHQPEANAIAEGRVQVNTPFKISNCCRVLQHYVTFDATSLWLTSHSFITVLKMGVLWLKPHATWESFAIRGRYFTKSVPNFGRIRQRNSPISSKFISIWQCVSHKPTPQRRPGSKHSYFITTHLHDQPTNQLIIHCNIWT